MRFKILPIIYKIIIFCVIWMLVGPQLIDVNDHPFIGIYGCNDPFLSWIIYGVSIYFGGEITYYCIGKMVNKIKITIKNKHV